MSNIKFNDTEKWCNKCKKYRPNTAFYQNKSTPSGLCSFCIECDKIFTDKDAAKIRQAKYRDKHREQIKATINKCRLRVLNGITPEFYKQEYDRQEGKCILPSCGRPINATDHDHVTGCFRGLMCQGHNAALGLFGDSPQLLREAADYLERFTDG